MCDGAFAVGRVRLAGAAAAAVAAIGNENRFDPLNTRHAACQCQVAAVDRVLAELPGKRLGRGRRAGKDDEARRVPVDAMNGDQRPVRNAEQCGEYVGERGRQEALAPAKLRRFFPVPHRGQSRRLVHHDNRIIGVDNFRVRHGTRHSAFWASAFYSAHRVLHSAFGKLCQGQAS